MAVACSLASGLSVSEFNEIVSNSKTKGIVGFFMSFGPSQVRPYSKSKCLHSLNLDFQGQQVVLSDQKSLRQKAQASSTSICVSRSLRWWEKTMKQNMIEIHSAQELVDALLNVGDRLIVIDFYSPGCGGCKALHPKICQLAELNPNAIFLKVNYEQLKVMCHCLNIHVLPFFKLYRGAEGLLRSFSCTNATIKKFKDALAKHGAERCSFGPAKGLDESELLKLSSMGELSENLLSSMGELSNSLPLSSSHKQKHSIEINLSGILSKIEGNKMEPEEQKALS